MIKVRIFNMKEFLKAVDGCAGAVHVLEDQGRRVNINKNEEARKALMERFEAEGKYLALSLEIPEPKDYFKVVTYYISNL